MAHNAPYDVGFLKAACAKFGYPWPKPRVLDTAALARRALTGDEVPNRKLGTLAAYFGARTPNHRALDDARATVDVLHGLFARLGDHRVFTVGDAVEFASAPSPRPSGASVTWPRACPTPPASTCSAPPTAARSTSARAPPSPPG